MNESIRNIFVDLDGTLVQQDIFRCALLELLRRNPLNLILAVVWLVRGRTNLKMKVANAVDLQVEHLKYVDELVQYLFERKRDGDRIVLATAAHRVDAEKVASHLGVFDHVLATDGNLNRKGREKLRAIKDLIGDEHFIYAGNSVADRPIWEAATRGIFVNAPERDIRRARGLEKIELVITTNR